MRSSISSGENMFKNSRNLPSALMIIACVSLSIQVSAQAKRNKRAAGTPPAAPAAPSTSVPEASASPTPERGKKNERPGNGSPATQSTSRANAAPTVPVYFYEFTHPYYLVRKLVIEHDEGGRGNISFLKSGYNEPITDPLQISAPAMERIRSAFTALKFLDSNENYQSTKDYAHLGVMKISMKKEGRERKTEFNWTENSEAKAITEEYRKLGNQYIWMFEIGLARENQPLQAPGLMDELDSLVRRNELSDPQQLLPFIAKLSEDERIPLIARNHASKIIKMIEKQAELNTK
jgi:hypothetical protein